MPADWECHWYFYGFFGGSNPGEEGEASGIRRELERLIVAVNAVGGCRRCRKRREIDGRARASEPVVESDFRRERGAMPQAIMEATMHGVRDVGRGRRQ